MKKQNKLGTYLAVTAGAGCAASVANGAVTFYGENSANDTNADPRGIEVDFEGFFGAVDPDALPRSYFAYGGGAFTRGTDLGSPPSANSRVDYYIFNAFSSGAIAGDQNYAQISFDGNDGVYEAVGQFFFDGVGGGYLIAIATTNPVPNPQDLSGVGGPALSISAGKAMIDAAAVPEPSGLALLALGSTGLLARRRRKAD